MTSHQDCLVLTLGRLEQELSAVRPLMAKVEDGLRLSCTGPRESLAVAASDGMTVKEENDVLAWAGVAVCLWLAAWVFVLGWIGSSYLLEDAVRITGENPNMNKTFKSKCPFLAFRHISLSWLPLYCGLQCARAPGDPTGLRLLEERRTGGRC
jgi:hypothetical protein